MRGKTARIGAAMLTRAAAKKVRAPHAADADGRVPLKPKDLAIIDKWAMHPNQPAATFHKQHIAAAQKLFRTLFA